MATRNTRYTPVPADPQHAQEMDSDVSDDRPARRTFTEEIKVNGIMSRWRVVAGNISTTNLALADTSSATTTIHVNCSFGSVCRLHLPQTATP